MLSRMTAAPLVAPKLRRGDEIRVIAPSRSMGMLTDEIHHAASAARLAELGLRASFGRRVREIDEFNNSSVASRAPSR
jgi:muramoyltetrapeptide carboxypeptidase LdcA involved in peptidoglycan recycling